MIRVTPATLLASCFAPVLTLVLAAFAGNIIEGFALIKIAGIVVVGPAASFFFSSSWQLLFGVLPTFWTAKVYWLALDNRPDAWYLVIGAALHGLLILLLWQLPPKMSESHRQSAPTFCALDTCENEKLFLRGPCARM